MRDSQLKNIVPFADWFIKNRIDAYRKDMHICLTADKDKRHAYVPAFMASISVLELFSGLLAGKMDYIKTENLTEFSKRFMDQEYYSEETISLLYEMFRHKVAHVSQPYAVFDSHDVKKGSILRKLPQRRITWQINATDRKPPIHVEARSGSIRNDKSPWDVSYSHKCTVSLHRLKVDLSCAILGSSGYLNSLKNDTDLQVKFGKCMKIFFPPDKWVCT